MTWELGNWFSRVICMCLHTALLLWLYLMYIMYRAWWDSAHHLFPKNQAMPALLILHSSFKLSPFSNIESHEWAWIPPPKKNPKMSTFEKEVHFQGPSFLGFYLSFRERTSSQRYLTTFEFLGFSQGWFLMPWGKHLWYIYIYIHAWANYTSDLTTSIQVIWRYKCTPPRTNISPKNHSFELESPFWGGPPFSGALLASWRLCILTDCFFSPSSENLTLASEGLTGTTRARVTLNQLQ